MAVGLNDADVITGNGPISPMKREMTKRDREIRENGRDRADSD